MVKSVRRGHGAGAGGDKVGTGMPAKKKAARKRTGRPRRRDEAKAYFRAKLMDAAIEAIARHGFSGLSVSRLAEYSGLARGMVNLHFQRKDKLLHEVLKHLADAYRTSWQAAVASAGDDPADQLWALIEYDVARKSHDDRALIAWLTFRQEAITNPGYRALCD